MSTCTNKIGTTFANTVRISQNLKVGAIVPVKNGDTIELDGFRKTGEKDLIQVNFQLDDSTFATNKSIYIKTIDRAGTVISAKEAHTTSILDGNLLTVIKRRGLVDSVVVPFILFNGPVNTVQDLSINAIDADLIVDDSLRLDITPALGNLVNLKGAVISLVIELA